MSIDILPLYVLWFFFGIPFDVAQGGLYNGLAMDAEEEKALVDQATAAAGKLLDDLRMLAADLESEAPEQIEGRQMLQNAIDAAMKVLTILQSSG